MHTIASGPRATTKLPSIIHAGVMGLALGFVTSFAIIVDGVVLLTFLYIPLTERNAGFFDAPRAIATDLIFGNGQELLMTLMLVMVWLILCEMASVIPALLGGGLIGIGTQLLAHQNRLRIWSTVILGGIVGLAAGLIINAFIIPQMTGGGGGPVDIYPGSPLWAGVIGVAWGVLHSVVMWAWLERKMT